MTDDYPPPATLFERLLYRWWAVQLWLHRCPECGQRGYSTSSPRWEDDKVAQALGIAHKGCPCCGKGSAPTR